jgi:hypothetical protein
MSRTKIVQLLIFGFLVLAFTGGCRVPQASRAVKIVANEADEIALAAAKAAQAAQAAKEAQQLAKSTQNTEKLIQLLNQADEAAQQAKQAADEAQRLQQTIDDVQLQPQVAADVQRAQESAENARYSQAQIDEAVYKLQAFRFRASVDNIASDIISDTYQINEGTDQQWVRKATDVIKASFCDAFIDTLRDHELPSPEEVEKMLLEHIVEVALDLPDADLPYVAGNIISEVNSVRNGKPNDELDGIKDACEAVLEQ